jgi:hypothetical protein
MVTLDVELQHGEKRRSGTLVYLNEPFVSVLENSGMQPRRAIAHPTPDAT